MRVPGTLLLAITVGQAATALSAEEPPTFAFSWGSEGSGPGQFNWPFDVAVDGSGNVYVADMMNHRVQKFDGVGTYLSEWGSLGSELGQFDRPNCISVDGDGEVFVGEYYLRRIQVFSGDGAFLRYWVLGDNNPKGLSTDPEGHVYAACNRSTDSSIHQILKFSNDGVLLAAWGRYGPGNGKIASVQSVAADGKGHVYVGDSGKIHKFTSDGTFVLSWDLPEEKKASVDAQGLVIDKGGAVYACVSGTVFSVKKFTSDGALLTEFCHYGLADGECGGVEGVAIGPDGGIYLADVYPPRVHKFVYPTPVTAQSWADVKSRYRRP